MNQTSLGRMWLPKPQHVLRGAAAVPVTAVDADGLRVTVLERHSPPGDPRIHARAVLLHDPEHVRRAIRDHAFQDRRSAAPKVWAILGEEALLRIAPSAIRLGQLRRLRKFADLPNMSLTVVPFDVGPLAGLSCPFTLLWIEPANATIAYVDTLTGADYVRSTAAYRFAFHSAAERANGEEDTKLLLDRHIDELNERGLADDSSEGRT